MHHDASLAGQVVLVTGAAGDLGAAIGARAHAAGAAVALLDVAADLLKQRLALGAAAPDRWLLLPPGDIAVEGDTRQAVEQVVRQFGKLSMLVNNAAVLLPKAVLGDVTPDHWHRTIEVNITGSWLMTRAALPQIRQHRGTILNIASQLGHVAATGNGAYSITKAALVAMARAIAVDYGAEGVRAMSLSPGALMTGRLIARYGSPEAVQAALGHRYLDGRIGTVDEAAEAAHFLLAGGRFLNGIDLLVDGGYTAA
jgi:NAD(P)-dependent dehydrogenase (short-subunit alcohol dehydrogenase family)